MSSTTLPENMPKHAFSLKRSALIVASSTAIIALIGYGVQWWTAGRFIKSTDDAYVRADVITVSARVPGFVISVAVDDDQPVHKGEILARLDDGDYGAEVAKAQATMDTALAGVHEEQAALGTLGAQLTQQAAVIDAAAADLQAADAALAQRHADAQRYRELAAEHATSAQRWEQAQALALAAYAARAKANADVRIAHDQQTVLTHQKAQHEAAIARAQAQLCIARAALTLARNHLDYTVIRAATEGVVGERTIRVGHHIEAGQPLMAIVPLDAAYVIANFKETDIAAIHPGQAVDIDVDAYSGRTVHGTVIGIAPGSGAQFALLPPENATGNFTKVVQRIPVKITIDQAALSAWPLRSGMSVIARVHTREANRQANNATTINGAKTP